MRSVCVRALTAGLLVLLASPAFAQPPGGGRGMFQPNAAMLLRDDKVQQELKLTDDQKDALKKIGEKYKSKFEDAQGDRDKMRELFKEAGEAVDKAVPEILKPDQVKRLKQLEVQASGLDAFSKDDVKSALKLSDKQSKEIDDQKAEIQKDSEDLMKDVGEDREKRREAFQKVRTMRKDALDKVVAALSDEQKKEWKDLTGDKFEFTPFGGRPGGPRPGGPRPGGDDKPKDNKDK